MNNIKMCYQHKGRNSNFYCFDDQKFLCDNCFKEHRRHNLEVISEIEKKEMIYKTLNGNNTMIDLLKGIKLVLNELKDNIGWKLNRIDYMLSFFKEFSPFSKF